MSRAPFQVLVFPYYFDDQEPVYAIFKRSDDKYWQAIAGGGESNESPLFSAMRESNEEAGIPIDSQFVSLKSTAHIPVINVVGEYLWGNEHLVIPEHSFGVKLNSKCLTLSNEHSEYKWIKFSEAVDLLKFESNKTALWELNEILTKGITDYQVKKRYRIRVAVLIMNEKREILLVQHVHPQTRKEWWVPPGGGLEDYDKSVFECAKREVFEESGLTIDSEKIIYFREFQDEENNTINLEIFTLANTFKGDISIKNIQGNGPDEHFIKTVRWVSENDVKNLPVFPEIIANKFWSDYADGFKETKYLGREIG